MIAIIKLGSTMPELSRVCGDFEHWMAAGMGLGESQCTVVDAVAGQPLPEPGRIAGAVVTGSHEFVTDRSEWSERTGRWLVQTVERELPVLAICYGHQLLADAVGGRVGRNPHGKETGSVQINLTSAAVDDPLMAGLPDPLWVQSSHFESVQELPAGAVRLAGNEHDLNHAFRLGRCAWGVQFHPEFNAAATRAYVRLSEKTLRDQGQDPAQVLSDVRETPESAGLLRRFAQYVLR
ncbi:MAG: glutamine amidotransferase [Phycisphaerae bacterium]